MKQNEIKWLPLLPVTVLIDRAEVLISYTIGCWKNGIKKWVPSPRIESWTPPLSLSNNNALSPPSTIEEYN